MRVRKLSKPSKGAVRNATKVQFDGLIFDSKLEQYAYSQLKLFRINFKLKEKIIIFDGFKYNEESIRPISWTPDFVLPKLNIILETKGYANDQWSLKVKLIKKYLLNEIEIFTEESGKVKNYTLKSPKIIICKNQKEVNAFISSLIKQI